MLMPSSSPWHTIHVKGPGVRVRGLGGITVDALLEPLAYNRCERARPVLESSLLLEFLKNWGLGFSVFCRRGEERRAEGRAAKGGHHLRLYTVWASLITWHGLKGRQGVDN